MRVFTAEAPETSGNLHAMALTAGRSVQPSDVAVLLARSFSQIGWRHLKLHGRWLHHYAHTTLAAGRIPSFGTQRASTVRRAIEKPTRRQVSEKRNDMSRSNLL